MSCADRISLPCHAMKTTCTLVDGRMIGWERTPIKALAMIALIVVVVILDLGSLCNSFAQMHQPISSLSLTLRPLVSLAVGVGLAAALFAAYMLEAYDAAKMLVSHSSASSGPKLFFTKDVVVVKPYTAVAVFYAFLLLHWMACYHVLIMGDNNKGSVFCVVTGEMLMLGCLSSTVPLLLLREDDHDDDDCEWGYSVINAMDASIQLVFKTKSETLRTPLSIVVVLLAATLLITNVSASPVAVLLLLSLSQGLLQTVAGEHLSGKHNPHISLLPLYYS